MKLSDDEREKQIDALVHELRYVMPREKAMTKLKQIEQLVKQRSPEFIRQMERDKGLA